MKYSQNFREKYMQVINRGAIPEQPITKKQDIMKKILGGIISLASIAMMFWFFNELKSTSDPNICFLGIIFVFTFIIGSLQIVEGTKAEDFLADMFSRKEDEDE